MRSRGTEAGAHEDKSNLDVRADNILITPDRVYFADWSFAAHGAAWLDLALFLPNVWMYGGPELARVVAGHPLLAGADPEAVRSFAVGALISGLQTATSQPRPAPGVFAERMRLLALLVITTLADRERHPRTAIGTETLIAAGTAILSAPARNKE